MLLFTPIALATSTPLAAQIESGPLRWDGLKAARSDTLLRSTMIGAHAGARVRYGALPLIWDNRLASDALVYARRLARENRFDHDPQTGVRPRQGENLWMGTRDAFSYAAMAAGWIDERRDFKPGRFPDVSRAGDWANVGHYTQVVWPRTTHVGCAVASNRRDDYLVCRYLPAGNVVGTVMR